MKISEGHLVELEYTLKVEGDIVESSEEEGPLQYLHGGGDIPELLEKALEGKTAGDTVELTLQPEDAFGEYDVDALTELHDGAVIEQQPIGRKGGRASRRHPHRGRGGGRGRC